MKANNFSGKTVLITGASRGIGKASAQAFSELGANVGLVARSSELLEQVAASLPGDSVVVAADLCSRDECARAVAEVESAFGAIDVLISCAGVLSRSFVEDVTETDFELSWRLNVGASLWLAQAAIPGMRKRGSGRIVLVSSEFGLIAGPSYASYCSSKWGLGGLAEVLEHELTGSGITVCQFCPGDVDTDQLHGEHEWGPTGGVELKDALSAQYVAQRVVKAADCRRALIVVDGPWMTFLFRIMAGPRRIRAPFLRDNFKHIKRKVLD